MGGEPAETLTEDTCFLLFEVFWKGEPVPDVLPLSRLDSCKDILRECVDQLRAEKRIPLPGDVQFIVGGPPCQGMSGLNRVARNTDIFSCQKYGPTWTDIICTITALCPFMLKGMVLLTVPAVVKLLQKMTQIGTTSLYTFYMVDSFCIKNPLQHSSLLILFPAEAGNSRTVRNSSAVPSKVETFILTMLISLWMSITAGIAPCQ